VKENAVPKPKSVEPQKKKSSAAAVKKAPIKKPASKKAEGKDDTSNTLVKLLQSDFKKAL
jgi:hypothetical protein